MRHDVPAEEYVITLVESGEIEIDGEGRVWRVAERKGLKSGGSVVIPVERRRAEHAVEDYLEVRAVVDGYRDSACAHRLVWRHFNGPITPGYVVNHKDGVKTNNRPGNLECVTPSRNTEHAFELGLADQRGERNNASRLSDLDVEDIRLLHGSGGLTQREIAAYFGVTEATVSQIVRGLSRIL